jgi:hypothetical protein
MQDTYRATQHNSSNVETTLTRLPPTFYKGLLPDAEPGPCICMLGLLTHAAAVVGHACLYGTDTVNTNIRRKLQPVRT